MSSGFGALVPDIGRIQLCFSPFLTVKPLIGLDRVFYFADPTVSGVG